MNDRERLAAEVLEGLMFTVGSKSNEQVWKLTADLVARRLIAAGVTMPAVPCPKLLPGKLRLPCEGEEGHGGTCW